MVQAQKRILVQQNKSVAGMPELEPFSLHVVLSKKQGNLNKLEQTKHANNPTHPTNYPHRKLHLWIRNTESIATNITSI